MLTTHVVFMMTEASEQRCLKANLTIQVTKKYTKTLKPVVKTMKLNVTV